MNSRSLRYAALLVFVVAWFLPVIRLGDTLPDGLPGWQAFRVAFSPVWSVEDVRVDNWYMGVLTVLSALTNLVMLGAAIMRSAVPERRRESLKWIALAAFVVNSQWFVLNLGNGDWRDLRIGYYLWWVSFLLLAASYTGIGRGQAGSARSA